MVHLLVLVVVVDSDDRLITTFMSFAFGGRRICAWHKEFLHPHLTTTISHSQGGFTGKEKEFYGKAKQRSLGVNFSKDIFFTHGVLVDFYWEAKQA